MTLLRDQTAGLDQTITDTKVLVIGILGSGGQIKVIPEGMVNLKALDIMTGQRVQDIEGRTPMRGCGAIIAKNQVMSGVNALS